MENEEVLLTQEGFDKLEKQLEYLKTTERTEIAGRIKVALGYGDLSENSEYDEAKAAQELNENKIAIRFSTRNLDKSGKIINIPIFMAEYIDKFIELGIN